MELPEILKNWAAKDVKSVHSRTGEKVWFRVAKNFLDPEYSVIKSYYPEDTVVIDQVPYLCGAAQIDKVWVIGLLDPVCDFHPL